VTGIKATDSVTTFPGQSDSSPGAILRRCREFHGLTLEEASESTKIGISHLKALENDEIGQFANQAYLKGFLRIYAAYLGLNSDDVARMYGKLFGVKGEKPEPACSTPPRHRSRGLIYLKKLLFPAFLLTLILISATFFKQAPEPLVRQPLPAPVAAIPQPTPVAPVQTIQSSAQARKIRVPSDKTERIPEAPPESGIITPLRHTPNKARGFILKIKVTQNGTLTATVDGTEPQEYELTAGDAIEWKAENKVALELSNAGGVHVELDGKPYKSLGSIGTPAYVELTANDVTR